MDMMIGIPLSILIMLIFLMFIPIVLFIFFLVLARGPAMSFIKARISNKIPILYRFSTGEVSIKLAKRFPEYVELEEYHPAFLPAFKQSESGKPDYWDSIKKPVYIVDERKSVALTMDDIAAFTELAKTVKDEEEAKNKKTDTSKDNKQENLIYNKILEKLQKGREVIIHKFDTLKIDSIQKYIDERWNISAPRAYGREYERRGEKKAGFSFGKLAVPFGLLAGAGVLIFCCWMVAKSQGWL